LKFKARWLRIVRLGSKISSEPQNRAPRVHRRFWGIVYSVRIFTPHQPMSWRRMNDAIPGRGKSCVTPKCHCGTCETTAFVAQMGDEPFADGFAANGKARLLIEACAFGERCQFSITKHVVPSGVKAGPRRAAEFGDWGSMSLPARSGLLTPPAAGWG